MYIARQQRIDKLRRQRASFIKDCKELSNILDIDFNSLSDQYDMYMSSQIEILDEIDVLNTKIKELDTNKFSLINKFVESSGISLEKFVTNSNSPHNVLDMLTKLGVVSIPLFEHIKDILWKGRKTIMYKPQKTYYESNNI